MSEKERIVHAHTCKEWREKKIIENPLFYKEEYYKNHNKNLKKTSAHYYKHHAKKIDSMREWRKDNPEKMRKAIKNWRNNNSDKLSMRHKRWMKENADHVREYNRKRRAMKKKVTIQKFNITQLNERMSVFGYRCSYCGGPFEHVDHVKPLSKGGPHCLANLRPACAPCNLSKHNKNLNDWINRENS